MLMGIQNVNRISSPQSPTNAGLACNVSNYHKSFTSETNMLSLSITRTNLPTKAPVIGVMALSPEPRRAIGA